MNDATTAIPGRLIAAIRRAFGQFLALPLVVICAFVALAALLYVADAGWWQGSHPKGLHWLGRLMGDPGAIGSLLSTVASSIITVTSITFSLLLLALQQGSSALTAQVADQFLMRRANQFFFGYFVGLSIFVLITLVTVSSIHRPVFGALAALILTAIALCLMVVMIYNTIDQMRPAQIVRAIREHVIRARVHERVWLARTRRSCQVSGEPNLAVRSNETGNIARVDLDAMTGALSRASPEGRLDLELVAQPGDVVAFGDTLALVRATGSLPSEAVDELCRDVLAAYEFDDGRDLSRDPRYGLSQLATIAWTSVSTAKSNPSPGIAVIDALRDIIVRWRGDGPCEGDPNSFIVAEDRSPREAIDALESLVVVTSESIQAGTLAALHRTVAILLGRAPPAEADALAGLVSRSLAALGEHGPTRELLASLQALSLALDEAGRRDVAQEVREASAAFAMSVGKLNSRSTRVPGTKQT